MSSPAFRLREDRFDASGAYGNEDFGTAVFGGQDWPAFELPTYHLGSDDLQEEHSITASEIIHYRLGVPVSIRPYGESVRAWRVDFAVIDEADIPDVKVFFLARVFDLLPHGEPLESIRVHWVGTTFHPVYLSPGKYSLSFKIQEYPE